MDSPDNDLGNEEPQFEPTTEAGTNRLWEEYVLIQAKIDKIGDFQFKVKSWSAALLGAELFGGVATSRFLVVLPCAFTLAMMFHLSERRQRQISQRLGRRASALERAFSELPPIGDAHLWERIQRRIPSLYSVPGIASCIVGDKEEKWDTTWLWEDWKALLRWLVNKSDDIFYVAQYVLILILFLGTLTVTAYDVWLEH